MSPANLTALRAFHLVAQAGGFAAAARAGAVSQPTLSAQVRALEDANGVRLFDRRGRSIALTPLGRSLHAVTARLFAAQEEATELLAGARTLARGHLRVSADSATHVMPLLAELRRRHPGVTFALRIGNSSEVLQHVLDHAAEVAVTAKRTSDPRLFSRLLRHDHLAIFAPLTHRWSRRGSIALAELAGEDLVIRERGSITREVFEEHLAEAGVRPRALFEAETREAVREAVAAGFGVGVVFESEFGADPALALIRVNDADLSVAEYLVCLEERRRLPLVRGFIDAAASLAPVRAT